MVTKGKPKAKPEKVPAARKASTSNKTSAQTEVQRCWEQYWARRDELEKAVALVREAQRALEEARTAEQHLRVQFDEAKLALKQLLDVEPAPRSDDAHTEAEPVKLN